MSTTIQVFCGPEGARGPELRGLSIASFRNSAHGDRLNISSDAIAYKNGVALTESYTLQEGDSIEFMKPTGRKG